MNISLCLPTKRSYAILGTGALGGFYGARLQQAGQDVHFLLHRDYEQVRQTGLKIDSPQGNLILPQVNAYQEVQHMPQCDVVIVSLKTIDNHLLSSLLPVVLKENGVVLVLQNGLGIEEEMAKIVGDQRIMGGSCFLCSNKIGPGHICHLDYGAITLGDYAAHYQARGVTERMSQIAADFEKAGITIALAEDLLLVRWQKLVWNIPFNGLSVVLNATTQEMITNSSSRELVLQLMYEVAAGAKAYQRIITDRFIEQRLINTEQMVPYKTSMMLDYEAGHPMEIEAIFGNPLRAAQQRGVILPKIAMLYHQLKFLEAKV